MSDGRSVLVDSNPLRKESLRGGRGNRNIGRFNELRLPEGVDVSLLLVDGKCQNRFYDEDESVMRTEVEPFFRYWRHALPPMFQTPVCRKEHTSPTTKKVRFAYVPCSAGPDPVNPKPCLPCRIGAEPLARRPRKVFTAIHLARYHLIPRKKNPKETYPKLCLKEWGEDRECPACVEGLQMVQAARRYVEFTIPDYEVLVTYNARLRGKCACGGKLAITEFLCPQCGRTLLKYTPENKEEFQRIASTGKYYCQSCGAPVRVSEKKACMNKCANPVALDVFNTILTINKARTDKNFMQIMIMDSKPALDRMVEFAPLMGPLDLSATFAIDLAEQRRLVATTGGRSAEEDLSEPRDD